MCQDMQHFVSTKRQPTTSDANMAHFSSFLCILKLYIDLKLLSSSFQNCAACYDWIDTYLFTGCLLALSHCNGEEVQ